MGVEAKIVDGMGAGYHASITQYGQLVTAPIKYSEAVSADMDTINTAYNLIEPRNTDRVVITGALFSANKDIAGTGEADVFLYEADAPDTTTINKTLLNARLIKNQSLYLSNLNLITSLGKWVNAKTDDNDVLVSMFYYTIT